LGVAIHGQSFAKAAVTENLASNYPAALPGYTNIGLLHTGFGGADGHERYAPCTLEDLRQRGYDYWALGHIHAREVVCNDPPVVFAGNVQGRHIREPGPKGCVLATICPGRPITHAFQRLDQVRWERGYVDVSDVANEPDVLARAARMLDGLVAAELDAGAVLAIRVIFSGATTLHDQLQNNAERIVAELRSLANERGDDRVWIEKVQLDTRPQYNLNMPEGPMAEFVEVLEQLRSDPGTMQSLIDELAELKRRLPFELFSDPDSPHLSDRAWLEKLLGKVQPMLLDRLQKSENCGPTNPAQR
jgi:DNA repair exonuclease SbcCD nuclease subunit